MNRDAFTQEEIAAIRAVAKGRERVFFDFLVSTGIRPGELYALDWSCVDLEAATVRIERNGDHRGKKFVAPKTKSGRRVVHLAAPLVADLAEHHKATGGVGFVLATREGNPMNPSNVRRDIWHPLLKRAGVRMLDAYSLRHTYATLARSAGLGAFDVAHAMGHSKCSLVDQVYAHATHEGRVRVARGVGALVFDARPQLRAIDGGASRRQDVDTSSNEGGEKTATG